MTAPRRLTRLPAARAGDFTIAQAATPWARLLGLAHLDELPEGWALHLSPCRSIHTMGMRFPLDLVWLDAGGRVLRVDDAVPPRRQRRCKGARSVVETRSGDGLRVASALELDAIPTHPGRRAAG